METPVPQKAGRVARGGSVIEAERRIALVRLIVLFALLPILWWDVISPESEMALTGLTALIAAYILACLFVFPRLRIAPRKDLFLVIDILTASALVYFTGGINSSLLPLLYLPVIAAALRFDLLQTFLSAIAVSTIVIWMWNLAEGGLPALGPVAFKVGLFTMGSLLLALFFGILAQETRLSQARASLNRALDEKLAEATALLRERVAELETAYALSRQLAAATRTTEVLEILAETARHRMGAPYGAVFLHERLGGSLSVAHARGITAEDATPVMYACTEQLADRAAPFDIPATGATLWTRAVCAPLAASGRLIGAVCAGGDEGWAYEPSMVRALGSIADQGGIALERAYLLEELERLALADPTARLYTREQLDRLLHEEVKRAAQLGATFALLRLDVRDRRSGRGEVGQDLLDRRAGAVIIEAARRVDVVARGEPGEFFVLLPMTNASAARKFAAELQQRLREDAPTIRMLGTPAGPEMTAGIAVFPQDATTGPELIFLAQKAVEAAAGQEGVAGASDSES